MRFFPVLLILAKLTACGESATPVTLRFVAVHDDAPIGCDHTVQDVTLSDLRFFVSGLELLDGDENAQPVRLRADSAWIQPGLGMIDLEDGSGSCRNGTAAANAELHGFVDRADYSGIRFVLGVPFEHNHANPLAAKPPLDDAAMHWHWRSGYKFLRAGVVSTDDGFWVHLGSTGCQGTVRNISGCSFPNRVTVELDGFDPTQDAIAVDIAALLQGTDLADGRTSDCSSGPAEISCMSPFAALGIDFQTGALTGSQSVFRPVPR